MEHQREFFIREISLMTQENLLDFEILQKYKQIGQSCLIKDFHVLFNMKSLKIKLLKIQQMAHKLVSITNLTIQELLDKLNSHKKTDITKFLTELLFPNDSSRLSLEKRRKKLILTLRKKGKIQQSDLRLFQLIYHGIYNFSSKHDEILNIHTQETQNIKSLLISLKKMMGQPNTHQNSKRNNSDNYSINLDIKKIISLAAKQLDGTQQGAKVQQLLKESESKKWLGPRLYKIIRNSDWDYATIKKFIDCVAKVNLSEQELRSKLSIIKKVLKKTLGNLRKYASQLNKKRQLKKDKVVINKQIINEQNLFDESIFLPDLIAIENKIPQISRNDVLQLEYDLEQFLIKSDEGTIFEKLCEQDHYEL